MLTNAVALVAVVVIVGVVVVVAFKADCGRLERILAAVRGNRQLARRALVAGQRRIR